MTEWIWTDPGKQNCKRNHILLAVFSLTDVFLAARKINCIWCKNKSSNLQFGRRNRPQIYDCPCFLCNIHNVPWKWWTVYLPGNTIGNLSTTWDTPPHSELSLHCREVGGRVAVSLSSCQVKKRSSSLPWVLWHGLGWFGYSLHFAAPGSNKRYFSFIACKTRHKVKSWTPSQALCKCQITQERGGIEGKHKQWLLIKTSQNLWIVKQTLNKLV